MAAKQQKSPLPDRTRPRTFYTLDTKRRTHEEARQYTRGIKKRKRRQVRARAVSHSNLARRVRAARFSELPKVANGLDAAVCCTDYIPNEPRRRACTPLCVGLVSLSRLLAPRLYARGAWL